MKVSIKKSYLWVFAFIGVPCVLLSAVTNGIQIQKIVLDLGVPMPEKYGLILCQFLDLLIVEISVIMLLYAFFTSIRVLWTAYVRDFYTGIPQSLLNYIRFNTAMIVVTFGLLAAGLTYLSYHLSQGGGDTGVKAVNNVLDLSEESAKIFASQKAENKRIDKRFSNFNINKRLLEIVEELKPIEKDLLHCSRTGKNCKTRKKQQKALLTERSQLLKEKAHNTEQVKVLRETNNKATAYAIEQMKTKHSVQSAELEKDLQLKNMTVVCFTLINVLLVFMGAIAQDNQYFQWAVEHIKQRIETYNQERNEVKKLHDSCVHPKDKTSSNKKALKTKKKEARKALKIAAQKQSELIKSKIDLTKYPKPTPKAKPELEVKTGIGEVKTKKVTKAKPHRKQQKAATEKWYNWTKEYVIKNGKFPTVRVAQTCEHCNVGHTTASEYIKGFRRIMLDEGIINEKGIKI